MTWKNMGLKVGEAGKMRSRERLIQVLRSVNDHAPGIWASQAGFLLGVSDIIEAGGELHAVARQDLRIMALTHDSPHIRELAYEALHYG